MLQRYHRIDYGYCCYELYSIHMALCVWMLAESFFDNRRKEAALSGLTPASTPMTRGGLEDLWSDEEDEDDSRLHFTCLPMSAPLSWYFTPFLGFDYENRVYPPPLMLAACPHSKTQDAKDLGVREWRIKGFHEIVPSATGRTWQHTDCQCFAGRLSTWEASMLFLKLGFIEWGGGIQ